MAEFSYGPVELLLVGFEGERPGPELAEAFLEVVDAGAVRLLDLLFISRALDGTVEILEIEDAGDAIGLGELVLEATGLASAEDVEELAESMEPGSSAALLVLEHLWAKTLAGKLAGANGVVLSSDRIPAPVVNEVLALAAELD